MKGASKLGATQAAGLCCQGTGSVVLAWTQPMSGTLADLIETDNSLLPLSVCAPLGSVLHPELKFLQP